jgi:hypothetical protein
MAREFERIDQDIVPIHASQVAGHLHVTPVASGAWVHPSCHVA